MSTIVDLTILLPLKANVSNHSLSPIRWQSHLQGLPFSCRTLRFPRASRCIRSSFVRRLYWSDRWVRMWKLSARAPGRPPMVLKDKSNMVRFLIETRSRRSTSRIELLAKLRTFKLLSPKRALGESVVIELFARSRIWSCGVSRKDMEPRPRRWLFWRYSSRVSWWSLRGISYNPRPRQSTTLVWVSHEHSLGQEETVWSNNRLDNAKTTPGEEMEKWSKWPLHSFGLDSLLSVVLHVAANLLCNV